VKEHTELPGEVELCTVAEFDPRAVPDVPRLEVAVEAAPSRDGKWTCSSNEEHWDCYEDFDTREEAEVYALGEFGSGYGLEDGATVWVGQIKAITPADLASHGADAESVIESLDERLYELVGDAGDFQLDAPSAAKDDLDARLEATIRDWMNAHGIEPGCWTIEHAKSHTWHQCEAKHDEHDNPRGRCVRHLDHQGEHEWPL
jgi:hypothetical protein